MAERRKQDRGAIWRLAQLLGRIEISKGLPGPRLAVELALFRQELAVLSRGLGAQHEAFVALVGDRLRAAARSCPEAQARRGER